MLMVGLNCRTVNEDAELTVSNSDHERIRTRRVWDVSDAFVMTSLKIAIGTPF